MMRMLAKGHSFVAFLFSRVYMTGCRDPYYGNL